MRLLLLLALSACAARSPAAFAPTSPASLDAPVGEAHVSVALAEDPPLPGEPVGGWAGLGDAPRGTALSVDAAVAAVLAAHPDLRAAAADVEAAVARRVVAGRPADPSVAIEWSRDEMQAEVSLDLTDLALAPVRAGVASAAVDAERLRAADRAVRLAYEVRVAVYDASALEEELALAERALDAQAAARDTARALSGAGNLPAFDATVWEAAYERARIAVAEVEQRRNEARVVVETLGSATGEWWAPPLPPVPAEAVPADAELRAVSASLDLAARRAELTGLGRAVAAASPVPDLEVGIRGARTGTGTWAIGGVLETTLPVFGPSAPRNAALATLTAARARTESEALAVRRTARLAVERVRAADARAIHLRDVVLPLQRQVSTEALRQYNAMQIGIFALLDAQRAELDVARAEVEARRAAWAARAALDALLAGSRVDAPPTSVSLTDSPSPGGH